MNEFGETPEQVRVGDAYVHCLNHAEDDVPLPSVQELVTEHNITVQEAEDVIKAVVQEYS